MSDVTLLVVVSKDNSCSLSWKSKWRRGVSWCAVKLWEKGEKINISQFDKYNDKKKIGGSTQYTAIWNTEKREIILNSGVRKRKSYD